MVDLEERVLLTRLFDLLNDVNKTPYTFYSEYVAEIECQGKRELEVQEEKVCDLYRWTGADRDQYREAIKLLIKYGLMRPITGPSNSAQTLPSLNPILLLAHEALPLPWRRRSSQ